MYEGSMGKDTDTLDRLKQKISLCEIRISETEKRRRLKEKLEKEIADITLTYDLLDKGEKDLKKKRKDTLEYIGEKKAKASSAIEATFYATNSLIPSSSYTRLKIKNDQVSLVDEQNLPIELLEGSAHRATQSFFVRSAVLRNSKYMPFMLLDEPLATLGPESSASFSKYLPPLCKHMQIILIEQKPEIFADAEDVIEYNFKNSGGVTTVRRV